MGHARLSIIDLQSGQQPIGNEDGTLWIVFNGEVFNYVELRETWRRRGHRFTTQSDTEVVVHLYEQHGPECVKQLNGQFAIAIWDERKEELFLARDRLGIRPLHYTRQPVRCCVRVGDQGVADTQPGSGRNRSRGVGRDVHFWSPLSPRTVFRNIVTLPPGIGCCSDVMAAIALQQILGCFLSRCGWRTRDQCQRGGRWSCGRNWKMRCGFACEPTYRWGPI